MKSGAHGLPEEGPESISLGPRGMHDSGWVCLFQVQKNSHGKC